MSAQRTQLSRTLLVAAPLVLFVTVACSSTPRGSQNSYSGSEHGKPTSVEGNERLARSLSIKDPLHKREGGRLVVQFTLENQRSVDVDFAWSVDWFDQQGFLVKNVTRHWEPVSLAGYGSQILTVVAPNPEAVSWKLQVTSRNEVR